MASRNERRRRARQRARDHEVVKTRESSHGDRMMAVVVKAAETRQTHARQADTWDPERTVPPPFPPDALWTLFEQNAYHSGAINAKVADAVGRGWQLDAEDDSEDGVSNDRDRLERELRDTLDEVCTKLTFPQLCQQAAREMDAIGWGAWEVLRERDGDVASEIVGVLPVPPMALRAVKDDDDVFVLRRGDRKVYFKRFGVEGHVDYRNGDKDWGDKAKEIPDEHRANELIVFSHYSPRSSWYGIPPWVAAIPPVAEFAAIREFNVSFFESGGQADRHIHISANDDGVAEQLAGTIVKQLEEAKGSAHVSLVTHGSEDTKVTTTPLTPKHQTGTRDREFRGGREDLIEEILVGHGVPPYRVGVAKVGSLGGDVAEEMDDEYRIGVVEPLQEIFEAELRRTLFGEKGIEIPAGWRFAFVDLTPDESEREHSQAMDAREKGVLSPNDAREAIGHDRVEDPAMDRYYIDGTAISSEAAVGEVKQLLSELKDALNAAIQTGAGDDSGAADESGDDDETSTSSDDGEQQVTASEGSRRRWYEVWRR